MVRRPTMMLLTVSVLAAGLLVPPGSHAAAQSAPAPQARQPFKVIPIYLACIFTEDSTGADEAYMRADGRVWWPANGVQSMGDDQVHWFAARYEREFTVDVKFDLYDQDGGIFDPDDYLGSAMVDASMAGKGDQIAGLNLDDADYEFRFRVERTQ
jgi:hypothetical protein